MFKFTVLQLLNELKKGLAEALTLLRPMEARIMAKIDEVEAVVAKLNASTSALSDRIDAVIAKVAAGISADQADAVKAELQAIADHLDTMGTDPANPVPPAPPVVPVP